MISREEFQKIRQEQKVSEPQPEEPVKQKDPPPPPKPILVASHLNPDAKPFFIPSSGEPAEARYFSNNQLSIFSFAPIVVSQDIDSFILDYLG